jgi:glucosamine-6-phosphate deaminase
MSNDQVPQFRVDRAQVQICSSLRELGLAGAARAARLIRRAIDARGRARIIVATGNSQFPLVEALVQQPVNWQAVEVFHMDEYVGISADHPSSFRYWIRTRLEERVRPAKTFYIEGDATNLDAEIERYSHLLLEAPIEVAFVGFGENGHIAFNDPHVADFNDPAILKEITLDPASRAQQAGEGHFKDVASVPQRAITITCPGLFRAGSWICCVPETRKAVAVRQALEGPISEACPASLVRKHPDAVVYLDRDSASLLSSAGSGMQAGQPA